MTTTQTFSGEIKVASRIVDYLSSGLYESPGACLKELVNNSFDADAGTVRIFVKPDADRIIIEDDGVGLDRDEFVRHFERVSESHKRDDSDHTSNGRPKVGKIGIGFIAANEICDEMEIYSTKLGSTELLHVLISFDKMRLDAAERKRKGEDFAKGDYTGEILEEEASSHYTHIFLNRVRGEARNILASARAKRATSDSPSLYGLSPSSVIKMLGDPAISAWSDFDQYSQTVLQVALNVPVEYYKGWVPEKLASGVREFERAVARLAFEVFYDGTKLGKPVVLCPDNRSAFISLFDHSGVEVAARGYFYVQHGVLKPQDLNGLLIRIRNAAVGEYDSSFLDFPTSEGTLFQRWISAEVWADDRLEDAMNIDRRTLRISHPAFTELQEAVHDHLSTVIKRARAELHESRTQERRRASAKASIRAIEEFATEEVAPLSKSAAKGIVAAWGAAAGNRKATTKLLRKYDVEEFYRIVLEIAREMLTPTQLTRFIDRLTKRLSE